MMSVLASRSDFIGPDGASQANSKPHRLFGKLAKKVKAQLSNPAWAVNTATGKRTKYNDVYFSQGAVDWERQGGQWMQAGVANVRFRSAEPEPWPVCSAGAEAELQGNRPTDHQ